MLFLLLTFCLSLSFAFSPYLLSVHFSADAWCHSGDSGSLQVPAAATSGRLSPRQRRRLSRQPRCALEPRHRHWESSQNGEGGVPISVEGEGRRGGGLSGKLITKEKARGSEAAIGSESVIRMGSDREKGKECGAVLLPLVPDINAQSSLKSRPSLP